MAADRQVTSSHLANVCTGSDDRSRSRGAAFTAGATTLERKGLMSSAGAWSTTAGEGSVKGNSPVRMCGLHRSLSWRSSSALREGGLALRSRSPRMGTQRVGTCQARVPAIGCHFTPVRTAGLQQLRKPLMSYVAPPHPLDRVSLVDDLVAWVEKPEVTAVTILLGEEGLGKTSLVRDVLRRVNSRPKGFAAQISLVRREPFNAVQALLTLRRRIWEAAEDSGVAINFLAFDFTVLAFTRKEFGEGDAKELETKLTKMSDPGYQAFILAGAKVANFLTLGVLEEQLEEGLKKVLRNSRFEVVYENSSAADILAAVKGLSADELKPLLPAVLAADLKDFLDQDNQRRLVLAIDTYGLMWGELESEQNAEQRDASDALMRTLMEENSGALFIAVDRAREFWRSRASESRSDFYRLRELKPYSMDACSAYLKSQGMPADLVDAVAVESQGHPIWLDVAVKTFKHLSAAGEIVTARQLTRVNKDILGILNDGFTPAERLSLLNLASTVWFDKTLFEKLTSTPVATGYAAAGFDEFVKLSVVEAVGSDLYAVRDSFRIPLRRQLQQNFPERLVLLDLLNREYLRGLGLKGAVLETVTDSDALVDWILFAQAGMKSSADARSDEFKKEFNQRLDRALAGGSTAQTRLRVASEQIQEELARLTAMLGAAPPSPDQAS